MSIKSRQVENPKKPHISISTISMSYMVFEEAARRDDASLKSCEIHMERIRDPGHCRALGVCDYMVV